MDEPFAVRYVLLGVVQTLVHHPDCVRVLQIPCDDGYAFRIEVHPADRETVFGPKGRTAHALRVIAGGATKQTHAKVTLVFPETLPNIAATTL